MALACSGRCSSSSGFMLVLAVVLKFAPEKSDSGTLSHILCPGYMLVFGACDA